MSQPRPVYQFNNIIVRTPSKSVVNGLRADDRGNPTFEGVKAEHDAYIAAMKDAGLEIKTQDEAYRSGVLVGSGIGGLPSIYETSLLLNEKGPRRISPFFIPGSLINLASGLISINLGLKGPNSAVVTACSTGSHAIGDAARIRLMGQQLPDALQVLQAHGRLPSRTASAWPARRARTHRRHARAPRTRPACTARY